MEITDRIKQSQKECKAVTRSMLEKLKTKASKTAHIVVKLTLELMEVCSKNGNLQYHKEIASKEFADTFLVLLKRVIWLLMKKFIEKGEAGAGIEARI